MLVSFSLSSQGGAATGELVVIEFIEQRPLLMALPGMASRFHKYYQYTHQELIDLHRKRKAYEQGGGGMNNGGGDDGVGNQGSGSGMSGAGAGDGTEAGAFGGGMLGSGAVQALPAYAPVLPLQEAMERPFGEAFLWAAGWDPRRPPLGGIPPKSLSNHPRPEWRRVNQTSQQQALPGSTSSTTSSTSSHYHERYAYSPATLVAEAVRQRMALEDPPEWEEDDVTQSTSTTNATAGVQIQATEIQAAPVPAVPTATGAGAGAGASIAAADSSDAPAPLAPLQTPEAATAATAAAAAARAGAGAGTARAADSAAMPPPPAPAPASTGGSSNGGATPRARFMHARHTSGSLAASSSSSSSKTERGGDGATPRARGTPRRVSAIMHERRENRGHETSFKVWYEKWRLIFFFFFFSHFSFYFPAVHSSDYKGGNQSAAAAAAAERERKKSLPEMGERYPLRQNQAAFLADLKPGEEQLTIDNKLYRAPLFAHEPRYSDFLLVIIREC